MTAELKRDDSARSLLSRSSFGRSSFDRWTPRVHQLAAFAFVLVWYAIGLRWIWLYRRENLLDGDEASYLLIAVAGARVHDLAQWVHIVCGTIFAPLTPGITAVLFSLFGMHLVLGFVVPLTAGALTLVLIFSIGMRIGGPRMAWTALVLVATLPNFVDWSRAFNFAMGSTLATTAALYCLLRSDGMVSCRWAVLFGFCVGLMPLTRAMTIAYVPGILLAAVVSSLGRERSPRRLVHLAGATIIAAVTTALWLVPNWAAVWGYLVGFGYGQRSAAIGAKTSLLSWDAWLGTLHYYLGNAQLIHSAILVVGVACGAAATACRSRGLKPMEVAGRIAHSGLAGPALLFASGTVALASTPNHGTGFDLPLDAALALVSAWGLSQTQKPLWRYVVCVLAVGMLIAYVPKVDLRSAEAYPRSLDIPGIGPTGVTDGRGYLQRYEAAGIAVALGSAHSDRNWSEQLRAAATSPEPVDPVATQEWRKIIAQTAEFIRRESPPSMPVSFGFRHLLYDLPMVKLVEYMKYDDGRFVGGFILDPSSSGNSEDDYFRWLTNGSTGGSCLLFTSAGVINDMLPVADSEALTSAARRAGFLTMAQWALPDGRNVVAWRRDSDSCRNK